MEVMESRNRILSQYPDLRIEDCEKPSEDIRVENPICEVRVGNGHRAAALVRTNNAGGQSKADGP